MNSPEKNNYIQYLTRNNIVKTKNITFENYLGITTFNVFGIIEEFFILAVFQNNIRVFGLGFVDIENNDMLGFINSDYSDISLIPSYAFLPPESLCTLSFNNKYMATLESQNNQDFLYKVFLGHRISYIKYSDLPELAKVLLFHCVNNAYLPDIKVFNLQLTDFTVLNAPNGLIRFGGMVSALANLDIEISDDNVGWFIVRAGQPFVSRFFRYRGVATYNASTNLLIQGFILLPNMEGSGA